MAAGNHNLGTIRGTIEIDYDGAGIVRAVKDTDKAKSGMDRLTPAVNGVLGAFGKFAKGAAIVGASASAANNGLALVSGTLAVLGPLAAAAFAAAPGAIALFAAGVGVARVALGGMEDALSAVTEDQEKFNEATRGLAGSARSFVTEIRRSLPALNDFQDSVQEAFFSNTDKQISGIVSNVGKLTPEAVGVADAMNDIVVQILRLLGSAEGFGKMNNILMGTKNFLNAIKDDVAPLGAAILGLAAQFGMFGGEAGNALSTVLERLTRFIENVDLAVVFARAGPIVRELVSFLGNLATIAGQVFGIFNADGANAASMLTTLAATLASFLSSARGETALAALGEAMAAIGGAAGAVFLALLQALAPILVALSPGISDLATQISGFLVPAIESLTPLLVATAQYLSENIGWIGPLAGYVVAAAAAYKVYAAGAAAVNAVQALLNSTMVKNTAAWIANTAATISNGAARAGSAIASMAASTAAWVANTASIVANRVAQLASAAVTGGAAVAAWVANTAVIVANRVAQLASVVAMYAVRAAVIAWTAVQWALNIALNANPIGLVVLAIAALVAGFILAYKNSETFRNIVNAAWASIKAGAEVAIQWFQNTGIPILLKAWEYIKIGAELYFGFVKTYISTLVTVFTFVFNAVKTTVVTAWTIISSVTSAVWNAISGFVRTGINNVINTINTIRNVINIVRNAFNSARQAASDQLNNLVSLVRSIPGRVTGALGNLGSLLYDKGRSLVTGFVNGIRDMIGNAAAAAKDLVASVTDFLPGSPAKTGPLSGRGYALLRARRMVTDIAKGIKDRSSLPAKAMMGVVNPISTTMPSVPSTGTPRGGPGTTHAEGREFGPYNLVVDGKVIASIAIDAMTGNPKAVANAAKEGSRQVSWTNTGRNSAV